MKITIDKITNYKVKIEAYYSNDIFSFTLETPNLFDQRFQMFKEQYANEETRIKESIESEIHKNGYAQIADLESLMTSNLKHVYSADRYFTNGQNLVSLVKVEDGFELGIHKNIRTFSHFFYDVPLFSQFSLANLKLDRYKIFEKAELEIMRILSTIQTIRIPIEHDADGNFLEVREVYPETYYFTLKNRTIVRTAEYYGDWLDKITENVFQEFKPQQIKCCKNCKHFSFSGMSHSMSGGTAGDCFLVREKLDGVTVFDSTTGIWDWCSQFERR